MAELAPIEIRPVDFTQYADPERPGDGEAMPRDLGGSATTEQVTDAVLRALEGRND